MWYVIVGFLKWTGILLLVLFALLVLLLLLVLFLPVRYRFEAEYREGLTGGGWVHWLYPVLEVRLQIEENHPKTQIRILGRSIEAWKKGLGRRKASAGKEKTQTGGEKKPEAITEKPVIEKSAVEKSTIEKSVVEETKTIVEKADSSKKEGKASDGEAFYEGKEENSTSGLSWWEKLVQTIKGFFTAVRTWLLKLWERLVAIWEKITGFRQKLNSLWEKAKGLWGNWEQIRKVLHQESTKKALALLWQECKRLLLALKPKKYSLWLHYGTGDAYTLAQHLRILAVVYGLCGEHITIEPDWEEKVLLAKGSVKGRIRIFTLARICIKVVTDKNVKRLWKQISEWERS